MIDRMSSPGTQVATATPVKVPAWGNWGIFIAIAGIVTVIGSLAVQFTVVNHGSSGQITIDTSLNTSLWAVLTGVSLFALGFTLWILFKTTQYQYLAVFLLAFSSLCIAEVALLSSLYQVTVTPI